MCKTCSIRLNKVRLCFECDKPSQRLSRSSLAEHDQLLCASCYSKYNSGTCVDCGRYRIIQNKILQKCKKCFELGKIECASCKMLFPAGYGSYCKVCTQKNKIKRYSEKKRLLFKCENIRMLYSDFITWLQQSSSFTYKLKNFDKYTPFFLICDHEWRGIPSYAILVQKFKPEGLRGYLTVLRWLSDTNKITVDKEQKSFYSELFRIDSLLSKLPSQVPTSIYQYHNYLFLKYQSGQIKLQSVRMALQPVIGLALSISVLKIDWLPTQRQINLYLREHIGQVASITGFVGYIRNHYQHNLIIDQDLISKYREYQNLHSLMTLLTKEHLSTREKEKLLHLSIICLYKTKIKKIILSRLKSNIYHDMRNEYFIPSEISNKVRNVITI